MAMLSPTYKAARGMTIDVNSVNTVNNVNTVNTFNDKTNEAAMIAAHLGDSFVKSVTVDGQIYYTDLFYDTLGAKLLGGLRHKEAISAMGIDPEVLGDDRITSAARRAMKKAENRKPFDDLHPGDYDGSESVEEVLKRYNNGEVDKDDLISQLVARVAYSRAEVAALKKNRGMKPEEGLF